MLACLPEGAAALNAIVCHAAVWVLRESRAIYRVVSEGIINLADRFFEMERPDAVSTLHHHITTNLFVCCRFLCTQHSLPARYVNDCSICGTIVLHVVPMLHVASVGAESGAC